MNEYYFKTPLVRDFSAELQMTQHLHQQEDHSFLGCNWTVAAQVGHNRPHAL